MLDHWQATANEKLVCLSVAIDVHVRNSHTMWDSFHCSARRSQEASPHRLLRVADQGPRNGIRAGQVPISGEAHSASQTVATDRDAGKAPAPKSCLAVALFYHPSARLRSGSRIDAPSGSANTPRMWRHLPRTTIPSWAWAAWHGQWLWVIACGCLVKRQRVPRPYNPSC